MKNIYKGPDAKYFEIKGSFSIDFNRLWITLKDSSMVEITANY